jgi:hypothetical protein
MIEGGVLRDGRLYALDQRIILGVPATHVAPFSVSDDDGANWTRLEPLSDPLYQQGYPPVALAANYRAPAAWYRLLVFYGTGNGPGGPPALEHSADGGRTWQVVGGVGPAGTLVGGRDVGGRHVLVWRLAGDFTGGAYTALHSFRAASVLHVIAKRAHIQGDA